jgi:RNA-splicing ligase RtcB
MWNLIHKENNIAKVYCSNYEWKAIEQLKELSEREGYLYSIAFPDLHAGEFPVGYVMRTRNLIYFDLTGADIGCNVRVVGLADDITNYIDDIGMFASKTFTGRNAEPSLGGGNHFIEIDQDDLGRYYIAVHTGSRALGGKIYKKIEKELRLLGLHGVPYNSQLGIGFYRAFNTAQRYALNNSANIISTIANKFDLECIEDVVTVHNTIRVNKNSISHYKGASFVQDEEVAAIPLSMGEGIVLVTAHKTAELFSGLPHGAGRKMSRSEANKTLTSEALKGINFIAKKSVLDEAPAAYKDIRNDMLELAELGFITVKAKLKPILTVKE